MPARPQSVVRVADLDRSTAFYRERLGYSIEIAGNDITIVDADGWLMLLAGPEACDVTSFLHETYTQIKPGATIHLYGGDLDSRLNALKLNDIDANLHESAWGDRTLTVVDPDGYIVSFWTESQRTHTDSIALYASGPDALETAVDDISEDLLDWKPDAGEWSIREIVHHIVDSDATSLFGLKMALAEPGKALLGNPYNLDTWSESLDYPGRDIAPALDLLRATRAHILQLLQHLPDAMERSISNQDGHTTTVETLVSMYASHLMIHVVQIRDVLDRCEVPGSGNPLG